MIFQLYATALAISPCSRLHTARVIPHPGHGLPNINLKTHMLCVPARRSSGSSGMRSTASVAAARMRASLLYILDQRTAFSIFEISRRDYDYVYKPPYAAASGGEDHEYPGGDVPGVEPVHA